VQNTSAVSFKTMVTKDCGHCHEEQFETYRDTMHGQVNALGWGNTAKCYDCHGSHDIVKVKEKSSKVHPERRLKTCESCHNGKKAGPAAPGFVSFEPHGHGGDFQKYPAIWIATKGMIALLVGTFAFFWTHLLLWLYREWKERKAGVTHTRVDIAALGIPPGKHVRRFGPWVRIGHLLFAISLMMLTLTGMPLMYAESSWAPAVMKLLGGPSIAQLIHRIFATSFAVIFIVHVLWLVGYLVRNWKTFKIFGPNSLVPGLQDLKDVIAMFKWFLGQGPRPIFDRWTYWEKFDYWAPFWGVTIIGSSGFMMWFPHITAQYLPGWVFNVAMIAHGEEAFLAAVFLFTVHFFNSHFRPDKFPLDIVMFTGSLSLEHFAREHTVQYRRLVESGELHKYLVDAPSPGLTLRSKILGFALIAFGLGLLVMVISGFLQTL
jgi:cytochrome b subunit of formate dehydrogenase